MCIERHHPILLCFYNVSTHLRIGRDDKQDSSNGSHAMSSGQWLIRPLLGVFASGSAGDAGGGWATTLPGSWEASLFSR